MKRLYYLILTLLLSSCSGRNIISQEQYNEYAEQIGFFLPDSLRTPEQNAIRDKYVKVAFANTEIRNNEMHLTVGRDYFVEQGLPAFCYDMVMFDYDNNNKFIKDAIKNSELSIDLEASFKDIIPNIISTDSLDSAMRAAVAAAKSGDAVLLSPACASFDLFKNYCQRGELFKQWVKESVK